MEGIDICALSTDPEENDRRDLKLEGRSENMEREGDGPLPSTPERYDRNQHLDRPSRSNKDAKVGCWEYDFGNREELLWLSEGILQMFGIQESQEGVVPLSVMEKCILERDLVRRTFRKMILYDEAHDIEYEMMPLDGGQKKTVHSVAEIIRDPDGRPIKIMGTIQDVTESKEISERLSRMNRELLAIKECDRALVRANNEQELLHDICRIVRDIAGYRLAWVGMTMQDQNRSIVPVAWSGFYEEYVKGIRATWGDDEYGMGVAGMCIKTGTAQFIQDIENDVRSEPWLQKALMNQFHSVIALPLLDSDIAFGTILLYSDQVKGRFTPEEVALLEEMAQDLSFGIMTLRVRKDREKAIRAVQNKDAINRTLLELAQLQTFDSQELLKKALDSLIRITHSQVGYVGLLDKNRSTLSIKQFSVKDMEQEVVNLQDRSFKIDGMGLWAETIRQAEPVMMNGHDVHLAAGIEWPIDHLSLRGHLSVPIIERGRVVGVAGIGNEEGSYTSDDATNVSFFVDRMWSLVRKIRTQKELADSEQNFRNLIENAPEAIYLATNEFRFAYVNPSAVKLFGAKSENDLLGTSTLDRIHPSLHSLIRERVNDLTVEKRPVETLEEVYLRMDGTPIDVEVNAVPLTGQGDVSMMIIIRDITVRKRAQEALSRSEQMLKTIIDHFPGMVYWKDRDLNYLGANMESARFAGFKDPSEYVGRSDHEMPWAQTEAESYRAADRQVIKSGRPALHIIDGQHRADGKIRWLDTCKVPLRDEDGNIFGILGTSIDITERKLAEDALREANLIVENSPVILFRWRYELGWPVDLVSKNIVRFGYDPGVFLNGSLLYADIIHPDDLEAVKNGLDDHIRSSTSPFEQTYRIRSSDGEYHWVDELTTVERDTEGEVTHLQGIVIDVTERIEAERRLQAINEALREGEEKYQELFELGSEAVFLIENSSGKILECNTAASEMYGHSHKELTASYSRDLVMENDGSESKTIENRNGSVIVPLEYHRRKDGRVFPVEINSRYFTWKGDQVHVAAVRDITDRIRTSEALRQVNKKLNLLNSITRHDLNNQMTALTGNLALAQLKKADPSFDKYMQNALASADNMAAIIRFAEAYEEIGVHDAIWQDLKTLVIESVRDVPPNKIRVVNDVPAGVEVYADPLIRKVFYNMIDNAIRHGECTTTIRFSIEKVDGNHSVVCEDDGVGISAVVKGKLFNRGFGKNHGLGLFLSREILAITGITLTEEGESGQGARFVMSLPKNGIRGC